MTPTRLLLATLPLVAAGHASASAAAAKRMALLCKVQTVHNLNCGGGLRPPDEPPPDCTNFVSTRFGEFRTIRLDPSPHDMAGRRGDAEFLQRESGRIRYRSPTTFMTDAAGSSFEQGTCSAITRRPSKRSPR